MISPNITPNELRRLQMMSMSAAHPVSQPVKGMSPIWPRISIVTASYNQGCYIEKTIQSLIDQKYTNLEYFIFDAVSKDETHEILRKHREFPDKIVIEPDEGAADAIDKGMRAATGELFNWLNSDDYLYCNTLKSLAVIATKYPNFDIYAFCGAATWPNGPLVANFSSWPSMDVHLASCAGPFAQESTFLRLDFLRQKRIYVRKELKNLFDTVLYAEMLCAGARVLFINCFGGVILHHEHAKTSIGVPISDHRFKDSLYLKVFPFRRLIWQTIARTRMARLQLVCLRLPLVRDALKIVFDLNLGNHAYCSFVGADLEDPSSWIIKSNPGIAKL